MVKIIFDKKFQKTINKIKDNSIRDQIKKQINKLIDNPELGKPLRYNRKGTRELYVKPFRLSYRFYLDKDLLEFLDLYHKDEQ